MTKGKEVAADEIGQFCANDFLKEIEQTSADWESANRYSIYDCDLASNTRQRAFDYMELLARRMVPQLHG